jgi:hypothetical protein
MRQNNNQKGKIMRSILKLALVSVLALFVITGCRSSEILNVANQPALVETKATEADMFKAIKTAGASLGWQVKKVSKGKAEATLLIRDHTAIVTVDYNKSDFSITYKDSSNLDYVKEKNTIHSNYNGWIMNLKNAIALQLSMI